jgi:hypothetical protein
MSFDDILDAVDDPDEDIIEGSPEDGPPPYFQCPLLPCKTEDCP